MLIDNTNGVLEPRQSQVSIGSGATAALFYKVIALLVVQESFMYYAVGWPKKFSASKTSSIKNIGPILAVRSSRERRVIATVSATTVCLWNHRPRALIAVYVWPERALKQMGYFVDLHWKSDASALAIRTNKGFIVILNVCKDSLNQKDHELYRIKSKSIICRQEEIIVTTRGGNIFHYKWDGLLYAQLTVQINNIPFSADQSNAKASFLSPDDSYIIAIEYSRSLHGYAIILEDGRGAFVLCSAPTVSPNSLYAVWAKNTSTATCIAINNKYRFIVFGLSNGQAAAYNLDEVTGALNLSHKLKFVHKDPIDVSSVAGAVRCIRWSPDGCVLAMSWEKCGLAIWTVFGSLILCTLRMDYRPLIDGLGNQTLQIRDLDWDVEGYHLWFVVDKSETFDSSPECIYQMQFVKSASSVNPNAGNICHVLLQAEDRLYLHILDSNSTSGYLRSVNDINSYNSSLDERSFNKGNQPNQSQADINILLGSKQWCVIQVPSSYMVGENWPIRYSAIDKTGRYLAVAAVMGIAHYSIATQKWKLFGNIAQEQNFSVTGGLAWWKDMLMVACYNIQQAQEELRIYPRGLNLDNAFMTSEKLSSSAILLNVYRDFIMVYGSNCKLRLYKIEKKEKKQHHPVAVLHRLQDISLESYVPHGNALISVTLTCINAESDEKEPESLLLNIAGRLILLPRDRSKKATQAAFSCPIALSSTVEMVWSTPRTRTTHKYLTDALWLGCGADGMKVWLPLYPSSEGKQPNFVAKRIMLPFKLDVYPQAVLFEEAVILGASNETIDLKSPGKSDVTFPFYSIDRTTQIYLHHILRQLLRRNLDVHAYEVARCCMSLPYFSHILELMLHEVLEEEATASEPMPDALLPRIVAFIQEFPSYYHIVVHCARKTEFDLWDYLFAAVGNPKNMFEECLASGDLETATSCLIILQNLEPSDVSRLHATLLLDTALAKHKWELAQDVVRFLRAAGPCSDTPPRTSISSSGPLTPPVTPTRSGETTSWPSSKKNSLVISGSTIRDRLSQSTAEKGYTVEETEFYVDSVLKNHATNLLKSCQLRELGLFSAYLDFPLYEWLIKERVHITAIEDFPSCLLKIHKQFDWPFPGNNSESSSDTAKTEEAKKILLEDLTHNALNLRQLSLEDSSTNYQRATSEFTPDSNIDSSQYQASILTRMENNAASHLLAPEYLKAPSSNDSLVTSVDTSCAASVLEDVEDTTISFADVDDMYEEVIMNCHPQRAMELSYGYRKFVIYCQLMALGNINSDTPIASPNVTPQGNLSHEESVEKISTDTLSSVEKPHENIVSPDPQNVQKGETIPSTIHPIESSSPTEKGSDCIIS
ncbi:uncharacterized protein TRIADDRAFT_58051 [Trichoplax adhaerens]|uniref:Protein RIC1 homolog n=1 Tax=Trichoplax adhaerens TaxID=10228 RepID=B3S2J8_TRIAD|nr:hypothetical protein TRIADDRAFT_58051 [Trichoplax adhaerens]EDV23434.1 hypothetical protein TRIADDRAFT_58051 [Trichoplax adhaerens]|eukprot:XP_002114344.1 hypothetical protein TRIADDRAFT_58051 [Trichoplax adhaerens]